MALSDFGEPDTPMLAKRVDDIAPERSSGMELYLSVDRPVDLRLDPSAVVLGAPSDVQRR